MIGFKVSLNGKDLGVCGYEDWAVLSAHLTAARANRETVHDDLFVHVRALAFDTDPPSQQHMQFVNEKLSVGDKLEFEIVETSTFMEPYHRYRSDLEVKESSLSDEEIEKLDREEYRRLKAKYESA